MKAKRLWLGLILTVAIPTRAADRVDPAQLPPAVKKTLDATARGEPVKEITVQHPRGPAVYDVELERRNALNPHVRIDESGELISDSRKILPSDTAIDYSDGVSVPILPRLRLEELPRAAQQTIQREAAGREVAVIHEDTIDGRKAYAAQFRETGRNPWLYVAEDGTILRPTEKPPALGLGTTLSDTPFAVQQAVRRQIGSGEIERIDKTNRRGEPEVYEFRIKDARGAYRLNVSADGRVLQNTRTAEPPGKRG